jgi:2-oxoglutarate dehydrogenase E2 component (dihydrolipoamide succinyltransferase)
MMVDIKVPVLPESVSDGTLNKWHKQQGDYVEREESLVDLETDKVVFEINATESGVLKEIRRGDGETVNAEEVIAVIDTDAKAETAAAEAKPAEKPQPETAAAKTMAAEPALSPAVRKLVAEHDLDPGDIEGTGKDGRIVKGDVLRYLEEREQPPASPEPAPSREKPPVEADKGPAQPEVPEGRTEERVAMTRVRQRIAERLKEAQNTAAMLTTFNEVDLKALMEMRSRYRDSFEKTHGVRLGFMSFFAKASVEALKKFPVVNASIDGTDVVYHGYFDIGIAVASPRGLVVPILRDVDQMSFADIERAIRDFGDRAQKGALGLEELSGGTFTITNGGVFGSLLSTPILNPPQSAILGMHKTEERAVVVDGEIVVRPMMYLALTYDHRIVDGREAVQFLVAIKEALEDPARMLLQL